MLYPPAKSAFASVEREMVEHSLSQPVIRFLDDMRHLVT
jgi:hypothetical protein